MYDIIYEVKIRIYGDWEEKLDEHKNGEGRKQCCKIRNNSR